MNIKFVVNLNETRSYFSVNICSSSIEATGVLIRATHPALGQNSQADVHNFWACPQQGETL